MISYMAPLLTESIHSFLYRKLVGSSSNEEAEPYPKLAPTLLSGLAFLCLAAYCALGAVAITAAGAKLLPNQTDNTYPETTNIYAAINAARTGRLYAEPSRPPYVLQPFGPLYYAINAALARASHLDFDLTRARGRLLTYGCFLLCAAIIFVICRRLRFPTLSSTLAALLFLGQPYFLTWNVTVRPDILALLMMLLSLLWAVEGDSLGGAGYVFSGILAGLAFLIKQPGIAAPVAIIAILIYRRRFRAAAIFALSIGFPVVLVFAPLLWHGGPFLEQFASVGKGVWSLQQGVIFAFDKLSRLLLLVPIGIGAIGFVQAIRVATPASQMIAAFAVTNWVVGFSGLPQLGADTNYFLGGLTGCALLLPFAVQLVRRNLQSTVYFVLIISALLWVISQEVIIVSRVFSDAFRPAERSYLSLERFKIFSDRPIYTVHGRDPDVLDPFTSHELELAGYWDPSLIIANIRRGDYDLVILADNGNWHVVSNYRGVAFFSPAVVTALNENYRILCSTATSAVLQPLAREVAITPADLAPALGKPCDLNLHGHSPGLRVPPYAR
jgi:hypothetical protein